MAEPRRFPPPWTVERAHEDTFAVKDANGIVLATVHCRDDLQKWSFGHSKLSSEEARRIAKAITRIPEFMMQRRGFYMHRAKRCGAKTRSGKPCQSPAMANGRCRMHGGPSPGAPKGNQNAFKHGRHTREAIAHRKAFSLLIQAGRNAVNL